MKSSPATVRHHPPAASEACGGWWVVGAASLAAGIALAMRVVVGG